MNKNVTVTKKDIVDGLKSLFPTQNPTMLVHSSLRSFGTVQGGAETVIDALFEVAGTGTVVVCHPTNNQSIVG